MRLLGYFLWSVMILHSILGDARNDIPAQILAKRTGAAQYQEEHIAIEKENDCSEHKRFVRKGAVDDDIDYEVYQGVVGRPGIDFPIYPRIPKTSFSCRAYGNGYFADMETDCQVFHICEEGRKISFLCPNGTIFQQSELTCDWWFKVNCLGSSGYYADSRELLNKQRVQRLKPSVPVKGFNILGGNLNIKPTVPSKQLMYHSHIISKSDHRMDSDENVSIETIDFDDLSLEKSNNNPQKSIFTDVEGNDNESESQIAEESSSFVNNNHHDNHNHNHNHNGFIYEKSSARTSKISHPKKAVTEHGTLRRMYAGTLFNNESTEKARKGHRGSQRYREDNKLLNYSTKRMDDELTIRTGYFKDNRSNNNKLDERNFSNTTPAYFAGAYSTARRLESTRSTPFYTPTVPIVTKVKGAENKNYYYKTNQKSASNTQRLDLKAPNFPALQTSSPNLPIPKETAIADNVEATPSFIQKSHVIGMYHNGNGVKTLNFTKPSANPNINFNKKKAVSTHNVDHTTDMITLTAKGPTYLPKVSLLSKTKSQESSGDLLLFAPNPTIESGVTRNLNDMLKTMRVLTNKLGDEEVARTTTKSRTSLDIPSSSGPDALLSLAQYFASEQNVNVMHTVLDDIAKNLENSSHSLLSRTIEEQKLSDTTATVIPESTPPVIDPIKSGLLSEKTVDKYSTLFGLKDADNKHAPIDLSRGLLNDPNKNETTKVNVTVTAFPQIGATDTTLKALVKKSETRKIAQVFSNALSSYLDNPTVFRQQLEAIRPTEPPENGRTYTNYVTTNDERIFDSTTSAIHTSPINSSSVRSQLTTATPNIAIEINSNFDSSTILPDSTSTTEIYDSTTFNTPLKKEHNLELSAELEPPTPDSGEGEEFLQYEQSQSFLKPSNHIIKEPNKIKKETGVRSLDNDWNALTDNDYFNPLIINDGLMKERKFKSTTTTPSVYSLKGLTTQNSFSSTYNSNEQFTSTEIYADNKSNSSVLNKDPWKEIFKMYNIPRESLPSNSGLQRIANKLFGGLNENEASHLKNVMAQAEHNRQVLSLLLLLIQACDDQNGKALERSRKHLLNALIDMDGKINTPETGKSSYQKQIFITSTTERYPATTYRRINSDTTEEITTSTFTYPSTTTDLPSTTNIPITTLSPNVINAEQSTKFEIRVEELDEQRNTVTAINENLEESSDKRALELLKSLYSLAAKFTSRR